MNRTGVTFKIDFENNDFLPAESPVRYETAEQMKVRFSVL